MLRFRRRLWLLNATLLMLSVCMVSPMTGHAQEDSRTFPETGKAVKGKFLAYWDMHGGLAQQGFPISEEMQERSEVDGKTYTVQYFERALFELHPENVGTQYEVLLSLLGSQHYLEYYGPGGAANQQASTENPRFFPETKHTVGGAFRAYWEQHGDLAQQGYPISDEFQEMSALDGKTYRVQYFQRAVFELHPENAGTPYEVLLTQLGTYSYRAHHGSLVVPGPIAPDLAQRNERASERYFMWSDVKITGNGYFNTLPVITPIVTRAIDLATRRVITVTTDPAVEDYSAISGSIVVGLKKGPNPNCPDCERDVIVKDLSTGATLTLATGPGKRFSPQVAGRMVAWIEQDAQTLRIVMMNIDTRSVITPLSRPVADKSQLKYQLSEEYLVWSDAKPHGIYTSPYDIELQAYNLRDRQTRLVAHYLGSPSVYLKLSGRYLAWQDEALHLTSLDTGKTTLLSDEGVYGATVRGDTLLWMTRDYNVQALNKFTLVGIKQSKMQQLGLLSVDTYYLQFWIAGDWIIWKENDAYKTISVAQAYSNPILIATSTPTPTDGSRFVQRNVPARIVGAGNSLFWLGVGTANRIYRYNLLTQSKSTLYESPEQKFTLSTDGRSVLWIEFSADSRFRIRHYDLTTSQVSTVVQTTSSEYNYGVNSLDYGQTQPQRPYLAVDAGVLYYSDTTPSHKGLWARTLATGNEQLISTVGKGPVAADGKLLWVEDRPDLGHILHVRTFAVPDSDVVLTNEQYYYVYEYAVAGDNVLWRGRKGTTEKLNRYNISANARSDVSTNSGPPRVTWTHILMQGNTAIWTEERLDFPEATWTIKSYDLSTGTIRAVLTSEPKSLIATWAIPNERTIAYTKRFYSVSTIYDLYIADLP